MPVQFILPPVFNVWDLTNDPLSLFRVTLPSPICIPSHGQFSESVFILSFLCFGASSFGFDTVTGRTRLQLKIFSEW